MGCRNAAKAPPRAGSIALQLGREYTRSMDGEIRVCGDQATMVEPADPPKCFKVLGIPVSITTPDSAVRTFAEWAKDSQGRLVIIRDVHGVMHCRHDADFRRIHQNADMTTPDGMPLAVIGKSRGLPVERTCGPDLMLAVMQASAEAGLRHYFYGGRDGVADELAARLSERFPGVEIVGKETPPFRDLSELEVADLARRLNSSGADVVWIGLSTPKQEKLMERLRPQVSSTLVGVGAAYDVHSGNMSRAPVWMQKLCLEGVYRFLKEPRRLWRRYLVYAPHFLLLATVEQLTGRYRRDGSL